MNYESYGLTIYSMHGHPRELPVIPITGQHVGDRTPPTPHTLTPREQHTGQAASATPHMAPVQEKGQGQRKDKDKDQNRTGKEQRKAAEGATAKGKDPRRNNAPKNRGRARAGSCRHASRTDGNRRPGGHGTRVCARCLLPARSEVSLVLQGAFVCSLFFITSTRALWPARDPPSARIEAARPLELRVPPARPDALHAGASGASPRASRASGASGEIGANGASGASDKP